MAAPTINVETINLRAQREAVPAPISSSLSSRRHAVKAKKTETMPNGKKNNIAPTKDDRIYVFGAKFIDQP